MSADLAYVAAFIQARLAEEEATARYSGPAKVAWLGLHDEQGHLRYTTVAAADTGDQGLWFADGKEIPEPASVRVVYDPARALRAIKAKRSVLAACTRAAEAGPDSPAGVLALAVLDAMSTEWEHPDRPFVPDWTIRPGVLLSKALEAQGKSPDAIPGARLIIEGTRRINVRNAKWIADLLGTSAEMWLNAQRLYDAAILRGAKDTSEEHEDD